MGDWIKCNATIQPTFRCTMSFDVGAWSYATQTTAGYVSAGAAYASAYIALCGEGVRAEDILEYGGYILRPYPPPAPDYLYNVYKLALVVSQARPEQEWEVEPPLGPVPPWDYLFIGPYSTCTWIYAAVAPAQQGENPPPIILEGTLSVSGMPLQLWRKWEAITPEGENLKYWWQCHLRDGWVPVAGPWCVAEFSTTLGTLRGRWRWVTVPAGEPDPTVGCVIQFCDYPFYNVPTYSPFEREFCAIESVEFGAGDDRLTIGFGQFQEQLNPDTQWYVVGEGHRVSVKHFDTQPNAEGWEKVWDKIFTLPAGARLDLRARDIGGSGIAPEPRDDVVVRIRTHPPEVREPLVGTVGELHNKIVEVSPYAALTIDTDYQWAIEHDEYAGSENLSSLPWKIDGLPPKTELYETYFSDPAVLSKMTILDVRLARRFKMQEYSLYSYRTEPGVNPLDSLYMVQFDKLRWTFSGAESVEWPHFDPQGEWDEKQVWWTATSNGETITAQRTLFSYYLERQSVVGSTLEEVIPPPECYRVSRANHYWPREPGYLENTGQDPEIVEQQGIGHGQNKITRPEDIYDWSALRYLCIWLKATHYPFTLRVTIDYIDHQPIDNHLTGQIRVEEYEWLTTAKSWVSEVYVTQPRPEDLDEDGGFFIGFDTFDIYPRPTLVEGITLEIINLPVGESVTVGHIFMAADNENMRNKAKVQPVEPHWVVKWFPRWTGTEVMLTGRSDDLVAIEVPDFFRAGLERGMPYIEWLYGAETGTDLSAAMTLGAFLTILNAREGWSATFNQDRWEEYTSYTDDEGNKHVLEPGYPWDVQWSFGSVVDKSNEDDAWAPSCCIGVRSWALAGGVVYHIRARQGFRGRLDGMLYALDGEVRKALRNVLPEDGVLIERNYTSAYEPQQDWEAVAHCGSDSHASWWSPALHEAHAVLSEEKELLELASWLYRVDETTLAVVGIGEWVWLGWFEAILRGMLLDSIATQAHALALSIGRSGNSEVVVVTTLNQTQGRLIQTPEPIVTISHRGCSMAPYIPAQGSELALDLIIGKIDGTNLLLQDINTGEEVFALACTAAQIRAWGHLLCLVAVKDGSLVYLHTGDGGQTWSEPSIIAADVPEQCSPTLAVADDGTLHVFWVDDTQTIQHASSYDGVTWSVNPVDLGQE